MAEVLTHAQLYDLLAEYFGLGDWDEMTSKVPYYKARMTEIGKLKRMMNSRHVDVPTIVQAAEYCHANHVPVIGLWNIIDVIPEARRQARDASRVTLSDRLQAAAQEAMAMGEPTWSYRLAGASSVEALEAWEAHHG